MPPKSTEAPTAEPTAEPTPEATPETLSQTTPDSTANPDLPTLEPTEEPTPEPTPIPGLLGNKYKEKFADGQPFSTEPNTSETLADGTTRTLIYTFAGKNAAFELYQCTNGKIKYQMFVSTGTSGNIEYSDDYRFLEDARVYAIKLLGTGRPVDNNCFVKLNIANLEALKLKVEVSNIAGAAGH